MNRTLVAVALAVYALSSPLKAQWTPLNFQVVDSDWSAQLQRIVMISANPHQLHIYNPVTNADTTVPLPAAPLSVSVGPDGLFAAVGYNFFVSYVSLSPARMEKTMPVSYAASRVGLAGNGYIYSPPYRLNINTGIEVYQNDSAGNSRVLVHPSSQVLYTSDSYVYKYGITPERLTDLAFAPDPCGSMWLIAGGAKIVTACGSVLEAGDSPTTRIEKLGQLSASGISCCETVIAAAHVSGTSIAALRTGIKQYSGDDVIAFYDPSTYAL